MLSTVTAKIRHPNSTKQAHFKPVKCRILPIKFLKPRISITMFFIRTFLVRNSKALDPEFACFANRSPFGAYFPMPIDPFQDNLPDSLNTGIPKPSFSPSMDLRSRGTTLGPPDRFNQVGVSPGKIGYIPAAQTRDVLRLPLTPPARSYPNFYNLDDHKMDLAMVILVW